jgi:hypothetical protein
MGDRSSSTRRSNLARNHTESIPLTDISQAVSRQNPTTMSSSQAGSSSAPHFRARAQGANRSLLASGSRARGSEDYDDSMRSASSSRYRDEEADLDDENAGLLGAAAAMGKAWERQDGGPSYPDAPTRGQVAALKGKQPQKKEKKGGWFPRRKALAVSRTVTLGDSGERICAGSLPG